MKVNPYLSFMPLLALACVPAVNPTPPDASDGGLPPPGVYAAACDALRAAGCPEGSINCEAVLREATEAHFINYHVECLAEAGADADALRACSGGVKCRSGR